LELPVTIEAYTSALSRNKRQQLRSEMRRIAERSGVAITRCTRSDDLPRFLGALFDLHSQRRKQQGDEGTFRRKPRQVHFYRQFMPIAFERGWLRFFGLEEHGVFKAVQLGYVYNNVFHQIQEGFDPNYVKGVGNVLRAKVIEACVADGIRAV